ncbi:hypothetical protein ACG7TL_005710 [Trametes sanguinea]
MVHSRVQILLSLVTLANTALSFNSITVIEDIQRVKWIDSFGFIMAIISDTLTTGVLVFNLHQRRTGIRHLNSRRSSAPGNEAEESYPEVIVMSDIGTAPVGALPAAHVDIGRQLAAEPQYKLRPACDMWGYSHDSEDANGSRSTIEAKVAGIH